MQQENYNTMLSNLMAGQITPTSVVGRGYKYPKSVASSWIRTQLHNQDNPNCKINDCYVMTNGKPFSSEAKAMSSKAYEQLLSGSFELLADYLYVKEFGVMPSPGGDGGYVVYIVTDAIKNRCH